MLRRDIIMQISSVEAIQSEGSTQMTNKIREGRKGAPSVHAHLGKLLEINTGCALEAGYRGQSGTLG